MISIVYADDNAERLLLCKQILPQQGEFSVHTCSTIPEGLTYLNQYPIDAIVSVSRKPGIDGISFLLAVREQSGNIPFILLTDPGNKEEILEGDRNGAEIVPWNEGDAASRFPELARTIRQVVQRKQTEITVNGLKSELELLTHRAEMLGILNEIISEVNNAKGLSDLLEKVLEKSIRLLNFDAGGIYFVDPDSRTAHIVHSQNLPPGFIAEVDHVSIDQEPYNTMFIRNQPLFIENYAQVSQERSQKYGLFSIATLPLISKGKAIGVLNIASMRRYLIDNNERETLTSISRELGSAIERIRIEEEKQETAQNFRTLFHSIDDMVFILDQEGRIVSINNAVEQKLQYSTGELVGETMFRFLEPEKYKDARMLLQRLFDGTENISTIPVLSKDGTLIEADTKVTRGRWNNQDVLIGVSRDVTERRRFEEVLQKSERRLNEAQHVAKIGSWELDIQTNHLTWSDVIFEIFEIDPLQFGASYEAFLEAIHPDDRKAVDKAYSDSLQKKTPYQIEHRLLMPDGRIKYVLERCETKYDSSGKPLSSLGTVQDITEQKIAETALKEKDLRYREIFEGSFDGFVMVDMAGHVIDANQAYCDLVGYTLEELKNLESFYDITVEKWRRWEQEEIWKNRLFVRGYSGVFEKEYIRKNGEIFPVELQAYGSYKVEGTLQYFWAVVRDITKRKRAEEERERLITTIGESNEELRATYDQLVQTEQELKTQNAALTESKDTLRETNEYLENLITFANVPIIIWDSSFHIKRMNRSFELLIGRSAEEMVGKSIRVLFPADQADRTMRLLQTTLDGVRWETTEIDVVRSDGDIRTLLWNSATLYTPDGQSPLATIAQGYDITERNRLEHEKDTALEQIQKNLAILSVLNDEIRNPLAIIMAIASMLEDSETSEIIINEIHQIDQLVTQLDKRWIQSEKVLNMIRKHYDITVSLRKDTGSGKPDGIEQIDLLPAQTSGSSDKKKEILIEEVQAQLYAILDSMDSLIYVADMDTYEMLYANKRLKAICGVYTGQKCYHYLQKDQNSPCPYCTNHRLVDEKGPTGLYQWEFQNSITGRWYDCRDRAIRWSDGRIVRMEIATDITGRKKAEEALLSSEQRIRTLLESIPFGILLADAKTRQFSFANKAIHQMLGYSGQELVGLKTEDIHPPDDYPRIREIFDQMATGDLESCQDIPTLRKDKSIFPTKIYSSTLELDGQAYILGIFQDITEQKKTEEKILDLQRRESDIINFLPDATFAIDTEGKVIAWNRSMEEMTGILAQEMLGKGNYEYAIPFYGERRPILIDMSLLPDEEIQKKYSSLHYEGRMLVAETTNARPKGKKAELWGMATPLTDIEGNVIGAIESIRDITELKETEKALRLSQKKYSKLFLLDPDAIVISDLQSGKIIEVNEQLSRNMGYTTDELIGKSTLEVGIWSTPETRDIFIDQIQKKGTVKSFETVVYSKSGRAMFVSISAELLTMEGKSLLISSIRDITERKQHEIALKESEEKYRSVVEQARDGIIIVQDLRLVFLNDAFARMTGYTIEELIGKDYLTLFPRENHNKIVKVIRKRLAGEPLPRAFETDMLRFDHSTIVVESIGVLISYHGAPADLIIIRDISERKRLEYSLLEALQKLKILTGITRHDIINDLNVITVSLDLILGTDMTPFQQEYITNALQAGQTLKNTIEFTREYEDFGSLSSMWVNLVSIVDAARSDLFLGEITVEISISADIEIFADPIIQKVFSTLFENSIRHGTTISTIRVSAQKQDKNLVIIYSDNGIGIEEKEKESIFKHGYGKNTGIGLYLARELLSITGLSICETGIPGEGARFEIMVPHGTFRFQT
ncbi:MAG: PAS domain S-box protein [Methanospirillum sp.]|uniref:PAS domain S-box protein n=1 Tax=Methanospirillum sp. TaxID=45200 RepID=UPI002373F31D|nr:PAS domain S-box protein [Methanospirillum sp.]MDD1730021.1 PAS domain S-box protein [Methanospirillum sp.]